MGDPRKSRSPRAGGRPPKPTLTADPARRAALEVLAAVRVDDAYTNLVLPSVLRTHGLAGRDAAFTTELVSGTLRRRGTYDAVLAACIDRPLAGVQAKVLDALRLGAHQLLSMRVPPHAALNSTVNLVRDTSGQRAAGFANAVLRRVSEEDLTTWIRRVAGDPVRDPHGFLTIAHSHPRWVVDELGAALAASPRTESTTSTAEELQALLAADNQAPAVVLVARPGRAERSELPGQPTLYSPFGMVMEGGDPGEVAAVAQGRAGVQDEGSQLVALALARAQITTDTSGESTGETWLDLCAGPGGKSALLAGLAESGTGRGAAAGRTRLLAVERQEHRARLVKGALQGAGASLGVVAADGTVPAWRSGVFDRVLVDAPCTGLGALRRRPEARWRRNVKDLETLVPLQRRLLEQAIDAVRPGGLVLYSTCSPVLAETAELVQSVLAGRDDVRLADLARVLPDIPDAVGPLRGTMQLWPHRHRTDAMFMALIERVS